MSMAIKIAKSGYQGDPGLFGFIGKALGGIGRVALGAAGGLLSGGPVGAIAGGLRAVIPSPRPPVLIASQPGGAGRGVVMTAANIPMVSSRPGTGLIAQAGIGTTIANRMPVPGIPMLPVGQPFGERGNTTQGMGVSGPLVGGPSGAACERGYHRNKTGYFTQRYGWIAPGAVCVRNRRRNPLNARALSRSLARITSAKKATAFLGRVSIRPRKGCRGCA
jgi:hypothetical protein